MEWVKANGGPLAVVFLGVGIGGFTYPPAGIALIVLGLVWLAITTLRRRRDDSAERIDRHDLVLESVDCDLFVTRDGNDSATARLSLGLLNAGTVKIRWEVVKVSLALADATYSERQANDAVWRGVTAPGRTGTFFLPDLPRVSTADDRIAGETSFVVQFGPPHGPARFEMWKHLRLELQTAVGDDYPSRTHHTVISDSLRTL